MKKVLIINEFKIAGGAEEIVRIQRRIFERMGYDVYLLYLNGETNDEVIKEKTIKSREVYKYVYNPFLMNKYRRYINSIEPDVIVVHNVFSGRFALYKAIEKYTTIQLVHDYSIVCPTFDCILGKKQDTVCDGFTLKKCVFECRKEKNVIKRLIRVMQSYMTQRYRKKYIDFYVSPSERLARYMGNYGYRVEVINNGIEIEGEVINRSQISKDRFLYVGGLKANKGIFWMCNTIINNNCEINVDIYGPSGSEKENNEFNELLKKAQGRINYLGRVSHEELLSIIPTYKYIIVPSKWMENYPTIVLEAFSSRRLVIGSDRGGIPELLDGNRGIVFTYGIEESFVEAINNARNLSDCDYWTIVEEAYKYVKANNSIEIYEKKWNELFAKIDETKR